MDIDVKLESARDGVSTRLSFIAPLANQSSSSVLLLDVLKCVGVAAGMENGVVNRSNPCESPSQNRSERRINHTAPHVTLGPPEA